MASSKLQAIGGFYLLPSIWELLSRHGRLGFGSVVPRFCSFPGAPSSGVLPADYWIPRIFSGLERGYFADKIKTFFDKEGVEMYYRLGLGIVLLVVILVGCDDGGKIEDESIIKIQREVEFCIDPRLFIAAKDATINYERREIQIVDVTNITGDDSNSFWCLTKGAGWVVKPGGIRSNGQNGLIITIPSDTDYHVLVGKQRHLLPKIAKEEVKKN